MKFLLSMFISALSINAIAENGTFDMSGTGLARIDSINHGQTTYLIADVKNSQTIYNHQGASFKDGDILSLTGIVMIRKTPNSFDLEGYGTGVVNANAENKIFLDFARNQGSVSSGGGGKGELNMIGGTGKYKNIKGSCTYDVKYLPKGAQLIFSKCAYNI